MRALNTHKKEFKITKMVSLVLVFMVLPLSLLAQKNIFEKYGDSPEVTYVNIKPKMFQMIANIGIDTDDAEAKAYMDMVKSITSFKTIVTGSETITSDIAKWVKSRSSSLEELMEVKDDGARVSFYIKEGKDDDHVNELLIFVNGIDAFIKEKVEINGKVRKIETVVVAMTGDIDLNQISKLTQKMNIPGGNHLQKQ